RQLPLDGEVPLLILRIVVLGQRRAGAQSQEEIRVTARGIGEAVGERIVETGVRGPVAIEAPLNGGIGETERRADLPFHGMPGNDVEEAIGSADGGLIVE